jgi:hypothetical protein
LALASIALGDDAIPTPPPRPSAPTRPDALDRSDVTLPERDAAMAKWRDAQTRWRQEVKAWEDALTPAQRVEIKQRKERDEKDRQAAFERSRRLPIPADGYMWRNDAAKRNLGPAAIERLARDKIAYGPTVKQSFVPYLGGPIFITSDSLLNAFHVLFEDTFREYELRQCSELRKNLENVFNKARENLDKSGFPSADTAPAWRQAQFVIGPALCLLGSPSDLFDPDVRSEIQDQVTKIRAAKDIELPTWLAPVEGHLVALDYRACKPIGFYAGDEKLGDYFRAVRWLQSVPFRGNRDTEVAAIGMLGYGLNQAFQTGGDQYFRAYSVVLGMTDSRGLPEAAYDFQNFFSMRSGDTWPIALLEKKRWILRDVMSNDEWMNLPRNVLPANANPLLAKLEYHVLPAYRVWDSTLFQNLADKQLEPEGLAIAVMLGSNIARSRLEHLTLQQVEAAAAAASSSTNSHESRHEPSLYDDYLNVLRTLNTEPTAGAPAFMRSEAWQAKSTQTVLSGWAQIRHTFTLQAKRSEFYFGIVTVPSGFVEPNPEFFSRMADLIERSRGLFDANRDRWDELASVTRKLEALAHKQIRQQPWSPEDEKFLKTYGERIAGAMGYLGNSYEVPNDDAPRWADVHHNDPGDYSLAVAVGRPRVIYVLYPWNGMEVLCQGSVMPYYEYRSKERLTDPEWKQLLDSPRAPVQPGWLLPFVRN